MIGDERSAMPADATIPFSKDTLKPIVLLLALCLAGCQAILHVNDEDAQAIVDKRFVGTLVGDFFQRYGKPLSRVEARDGTMAFKWVSGSPKVGAGPYGPEEQLCWLQISTDRNGRIAVAAITRDGKGQRHLSLCAELFEAS